MDQSLIFGPMGALVALTFLVLFTVPIARFRAARQKHVSTEDFKYGESPRVPPATSIPNRNYMNLLEMPLLFYVLCLTLFVTERVTGLQMGLAWAYFSLRALHSLVHLTINQVMLRLALFGLSSMVLMIMWLLFYFGPRPA